MTRRVLMVVVLLGCVFAAPASATTLLDEQFNYPDRLITNGWAYTHSGGYESPVWEVSSGSLFAKGGQGWTGVPDGCTADIDSKPCTYSSVFRAYTDRTFSAMTTTVRAVFTSQKWTNFNKTPAEHGIKIWNRLTQRGKADYVALVDSPTGRTYIKKKCAGGAVNGGTYYTLANDSDASVWPLGTVHTAAFSAATQLDGSVVLTLVRDGVVALQATDDGVGCAPFTSGQMGVRSDDAQFLFDDFTVTN